MSTWIEIKDPEDIDVQYMLSGVVGVDSRTDINILYSSDHAGNNYISIQLDLLLERLRYLGVI